MQPSPDWPAGASTYFIPGRRTWRASFPIPPDGYEQTNVDQDLMFRQAYQATGHMTRFSQAIGYMTEVLLRTILGKTANN